MKKVTITKEKGALALIVILSAILNFVNLSIEGTANAYYAAAVKSMTMSLKNFFFVSFDPAGFVTIDKPPIGFWFQAISAKIFGYSGWSILLPQALAGVISVIIIYKIVKRSFGAPAGLVSALCLAVTPVFVAASRNNTIDNTLVLALLLACWAMTVAAEKGKFKYVVLCMVLIGVGFNIKMLEAYLVVPAVYITYLLSTAASVKKRIVHLAAGTVILIAVSLSWALIVDAIPASSRPYVDSSTNNTVMELITGHNGAERLSLSSGSGNGNGGGGQGSFGQGNRQGMPSNFNQQQKSNNTDAATGATENQNNQSGFPGNPPSNGNGQGMPGNPPTDGGHMGGMGGFGGGSSGLQGTFGGQTTSGITRLFSKNILSDQIVWFIPLAVLGFIAAAIKEKLVIKLNNTKKQSLVLWFMWFLPEFIYFSFNTGTFHPYYLTMLAPPIAALAGIGITTMWELYKKGGWKAWFLPAALILNGAVDLLMLNYFIDYSSIIKILIVLVIVLCFGASIVLSILNFVKKKEENLEENKESNSTKLKKLFVGIALTGVLITPFVGSSAAMFYKINGTIPAAGLELLSNTTTQQMGNFGGNDDENSSSSKLIEFLEKNKTANQKYLLVVSNSNSASDIIIKTGEPVMAIGGFLGNDKSITLDTFKELVKKGEIRYVMAGGNKGGDGSGNSTSEIMNWVEQNGKVVSTSEYSNATSTSTQSDSSSTDSTKQNRGGFDGGMSGQLYDLKAYTDSSSTK